MKSFQLGLTFLVLFFSSRTIWADIILLKSGKILEGKFIETNSHYTILNNFDHNIRISNQEIASMEVGYSGIPVCYQLKNQEELCNGKLHLLSQSKVVIVYGKGYLEILELEPDDFLFIKVSPDPQDKNITKFIREGIGMEVDMGNHQIKKGKLIAISDDGVLTLESDSDEVYLIPDSSIVNFTYYSPSLFSFSNKVNLVRIVPGLVQIHNGKTWKGGAIMGLGTITFVGAIVEFNLAQKESNPQVSYIPVGSQLIATSALNDNKSFQYHKKNFQLLTLGFLFVYLYHFYDIYSSNPESQNSSIYPSSYQNYIFQTIYSPEKPGPYSIWNYGNSQYLEYSYRF